MTTTSRTAVRSSALRRVALLAAAIITTLTGGLLALSTPAHAAPASGGTQVFHVMCSTKETIDTWFDVTADVTVDTNNSFGQITAVNNIAGYLGGVTAFEDISNFNGGTYTISDDKQSVTISGTATMTGYVGTQLIPVMQAPVSCSKTWNIHDLPTASS
ncbi:hypothetical protein [Actinoallomurus rhizosphaericola]|uniref:hypothetical protein n=1 Tax=Actinoallomurus rhizosphaericola TaxID=2952536 RepID=UPI0020933CB7|nr:hypothetical protein [Actinoallomurus rhizosphaericola]MCO5999684.1 hypothetical protein [Actinoallomurus rhizosphaericola]